MRRARATAARRGDVSIAMTEVTAEYFPGQPILDALSLVAEPARVTLILGPNGSGKSTALRVLAGLLPARAGEVLLTRGDEVTVVTQVPAHERAEQRIAYLPQGHSVFPSMSVHQNLMMGGWSLRRDRAALSAAVDSVYERYPLLRGKRRVPAASLSGGQQRILEVARLLVPDPDIVLIDEPSAGVAPAIAASMYQEIAAMKADRRTIVLIDQDVRPALAIADTVYTLRSGRNDRTGPVAEFSADVTGLVRDWLAVPVEAGPAETMPSQSEPDRDQP
jgi:branched-chain amino acid transport system ATP-binding protein